MRLSQIDAGFLASAAAHALMLGATLFVFSRPQKLDDVSEAIPIETITEEAFSKIAKGERYAKESKPVQKADKVADQTLVKPTPDHAEAHKDTMPPPPPDPFRLHPAESDSPEEKQAEQSPPPPPPPRPSIESPSIPLVAPPKRPVSEQVAIKEKETAPAETEDDKSDAPKPPTRPSIAVKEAPKQPAPPMNRPVVKPSMHPDDIKKLLTDSHSDSQSGARPHSGQEAEKSHLLRDDRKILADLSKEALQATPSTGAERVKAVSLGASNGTAQTMQVNIHEALGVFFDEQYSQKCWGYWGQANESSYVPKVHIEFNSDGSLAKPPELKNPSDNPAFISLGEAALASVNKCNPLHFPSDLLSHYKDWKSVTINISPKSTLR